MVVVPGIITAAAVEPRSALCYLVLFAVHVNRMRPVPAVIEVPLLHRVLLDCEARGGATKQAAVDGPLTIAALVEVEGAAHLGSAAHAGKSIVARQRSRIHAVVSHRRLVNHNLQHHVALTGAAYAPAGAALTVGLDQPILEVDCLSRILGEIDDHISAFRHA